ncbi:glycine-rich protein 1 isoform X4 [Siniperca chuatsi]|uniref:glycine-rich protein 1 isoform X4 n=1 Tax=Siniperca chuatsi TaxID=119488 RepID=UPI001CE0A963|nr:glycine-rich protein 1 isoform X4 [Siniperca chuatsi]
MLPPNLLVVSVVVFLATTVSMAPVEEKEQEEVEVEATEEGEGELSEEEEDDDDSKSQDKIDEAGVVGVQQTTTATASGGSGVLSNIQDLSASSSQSARGGTNDGTAGSSAAGGPSSSAASQPTGSSGSSGSSATAVELSGVSAAQPAGSDGVDSESNGKGQKLLNGGGGGGGADSQTGVLGLFGGRVSHLDYTGECPGTIDPSSHDFLLGLMDGGDPFGPGVHINIPGHMTPPTQLDSTVISSDVTAAPSAEQNSGSSLDSPADPAHHSDIMIDQSGPDHTSLSSGPDQSLSSSVSGSSHSAAQEGAAASSSSSHSEAHRVQTDGADSADANGNGRQTLLMDTNGAGGAQSVTGLHIELTAPGLGLSHDVTESSPVILHTESVDSFTHTLHPATGGYSHTDLVTVATDSTGTDTVSADPTGTPLDSSHPAVTDHTQMAGSVTEQYNPSGQGPEGAENVELEDTC